MRDIRLITPTISRLMSISPPRTSTQETLAEIMEIAENKMKGDAITRCFVYAPDAIGDSMYREFKDQFKAIEEIAPIRILLNSIYPTVTPVCFGSMFTGALPELHGIKKYEKPVLECDTLFDSLSRAGKKVALASVKGSSIALIFLNRSIDYHILENDAQVNERAIELIDEGDYDFILVYNQDYDDKMHDLTPKAPEALRALENHIMDFRKLATRFLRKYEDETRLVLWSPDHGVHLDEESNRGSHGLAIPEDMEVRSFWGLYPSS